MKLQKLGDIVKNLDSKRIPLNSEERIAKSKEGLYPYIGANNIVGYIDEYIFDEKILCVAEDGGSWGANQKCAVIYKGKTWVNNHAHVLAENGKANLEYLKNYLNYTNLNKYIKGSTRGKLNKSILENIRIPLPPLPEQLQIANLLSKAENLISQRKESIRLLDEFLKSTFLEMFGDPVRNEKGWEVGKFKEIAFIDRTQVIPTEFISDDYYIGLEDIEKDTGNIVKTSVENAEELKSSKFRFSGNHILYAKLRPYLNKVALPKQKGICSTDIFPILPVESMSNRYFISFFMRSKSFVTEMHSKSSGANLPRVSALVIENFKAYKPPLGLQTQFAQIVEKTEVLKTRYQQSLQELENLYGSLSQRAFRGELVVK